MTMVDEKIRVLHVRLNKTFTIRLWEDRTTAFRWHLEYDSSVLSLTDEDFERTSIASTVDAGNRIFEFKALRAGSHTIQISKRMGVVAAEEHRFFQVVVE